MEQVLLIPIQFQRGWWPQFRRCWGVYHRFQPLTFWVPRSHPLLGVEPPDRRGEVRSAVDRRRLLISRLTWLLHSWRRHHRRGLIELGSKRDIDRVILWFFNWCRLCLCNRRVSTFGCNSISRSYILFGSSCRFLPCSVGNNAMIQGRCSLSCSSSNGPSSASKSIPQWSLGSRGSRL